MNRAHQIVDRLLEDGDDDFDAKEWLLDGPEIEAALYQRGFTRIALSSPVARYLRGGGRRYRIDVMGNVDDGEDATVRAYSVDDPRGNSIIVPAASVIHYVDALISRLDSEVGPFGAMQQAWAAVFHDESANESILVPSFIEEEEESFDATAVQAYMKASLKVDPRH